MLLIGIVLRNHSIVVLTISVSDTLLDVSSIRGRVRAMILRIGIVVKGKERRVRNRDLFEGLRMPADRLLIIEEVI